MIEAVDLPFGNEIFSRIEELAMLSESETALTRRFLSPEHHLANELVSEWMREAGMATRIDAAGNVIGRYEGIEAGLPALVLGSHLDTVRDAGRFDGALGVLAAISSVGALHAGQERLPCAVEVIGFGDEEGLRFQSTFLGSRCVAGTMDVALLERRDDKGVSMREAFEHFGLDPVRILDAARTPEELVGYVEVHIEQGPVLEQEDLPVGVVTSISGATRLSVSIDGTAGHAGTVPMRGRHDALAAASEVVQFVESRCADAHDLVGTVGQLSVEPGAVNVIPGHVDLTVDTRSAHDAVRQCAVRDIEEAITEIARRRGVASSVVKTHESPSCACCPTISAELARAVRAEGFSVRHLPSGAGHDAMAMASLTSVAMLFVRCAGGVSHHPAESIAAEDADIATRVLVSFLRQYRVADA